MCCNRAYALPRSRKNQRTHLKLTMRQACAMCGSASLLLASCILVMLLDGVDAAGPAACARTSDLTASWNTSTVDNVVVARWYPPGPVCDAACAGWPNSCVYGCLLCGTDGTDTGVGLTQPGCSILNSTGVLTPGSVVSVAGKTRIRTSPLCGPEFRTCSNVTLIQAAPPSPTPPPPAVSSLWDGQVRLLGPVVTVSWKVFSANQSVTFLVQSLTDQFPIVGLSLGTSMAFNSLANSTGVAAYMGWLDAAGTGHVVSYWMTAKLASAVVPTGEQLYGVQVMSLGGRLSFQFNRLLAGSGSPSTMDLDFITPIPLQWTMYRTWASADNISIPLPADEHVVRPRGYVGITLQQGTDAAGMPPTGAPTGAPAPEDVSASAPAPASSPAAASGVAKTVKAHAVCMALAWGVIFPGSSLVARYGKSLGPQLWLRMHIGLNLTGGVALIIGFACIRAYVGGQDPTHYTSIHARCGLAVFILWWAQPLNGLLRPHKAEGGLPLSKARKLWELGHKAYGRGLMALAVITAMMGFAKLKDAGAKHPAVAAGQAMWVLWCVFALAGGTFLLERRARSRGPQNALLADGNTGLLDEADFDHTEYEPAAVPLTTTPPPAAAPPAGDLL